MIDETEFPDADEDVDADDFADFFRPDGLEDADTAGDERINPYIPTITVEVATANRKRTASVFVDGYTHEDFLDGDMNAIGEVTKILIARVTGHMLETWPINLRPDKGDYLRPKYGNLKKITMLRTGRRSWHIPEYADDFDQTLLQLPTGFSRRAQFGLGLKWEHRHILDAICAIPTVQELEMPDDDLNVLNGSVYTLGMKRFETCPYTHL